MKISGLEHRLGEVVSGRCRGRTLVVGDPLTGILGELQRRAVDCTFVLTGSNTESLAAVVSEAFREVDGKRYRTVLLAGILERLEVGPGEQLLGLARDHLRPGGRLVVVVPNEDCGTDPQQVRAFDRRHLKKLLRPLGTFRFIQEQPYRWLVGEVRRSRRDGAPRPRRTLEERYRVTADLCRGKVIDLGCGRGELVEAIRARGLEVVGVDISREKIAEARRSNPGVRFIESDIRGLRLPDGGFDTAVLAEVLEHLTEVPGAEVLRQAARLLKPGGRLVVSVPNEDAIPHSNHVRTFDRRSLAEALEPWGSPRLVADQPLKWLMMYVEKER